MNEQLSNITTDEMGQVLRTLQQSNVFILAIDIAARLGLRGNHESNRRHIRSIVKKLREDGSKIISNMTDGYFLTDDDAIYREWLNDKTIDAKTILAKIHKAKQMLKDSAGQGLLFSQKIHDGCALIGV